MPSAEGDLPPERLRHHQPLHVYGVDYFGPECDDRPQTRKEIRALFTCLTTRAVHIELAESLSSDSMILALHEERSRRPHHNGSSYLRRSEHGWRLGALVRSIKTALAATLRESPREEVLHTLLLEAEHIVNSRPLTEATDDNVLLGPANWRTCQRLADHFWQRWLREYLPTLVPAGRAATLCRAPAEGDIVLIVDSSSPRYSWPRGRIKKTYPGPDNQVRVVDVETTGGVLRRPTSKIVVLVSAEATAVPCPEV
ncbi:hypothetical protein EVAR_74592_1 [Eumeta japonica]|uniref:DUF5641 domain-containing protein n=1 Tax=Eumeta variegata TaxID=151549 RepID=A0A4C1TBT3_EUMVA|nr:hypothetical protein EVAR_74592_1 [Eumeta japonica]